MCIIKSRRKDGEKMEILKVENLSKIYGKGETRSKSN